MNPGASVRILRSKADFSIRPWSFREINEIVAIFVKTTPEMAAKMKIEKISNLIENCYMISFENSSKYLHWHHNLLYGAVMVLH